MNIRFLLSSLGTILIFISSVQGIEPPEWYIKFEQIQLMRSTRKDVENLFNHPTYKETSGKGWSQSVYYELEEGTLSVSYSTGRCSEERNRTGYNIDNGIAIRASIFLPESIRATELNLDLSDFEKYKVKDADVWIYTNQELGIQYTGNEQIINGIELFPQTKYKYLSCRNVLK